MPLEVALQGVLWLSQMVAYHTALPGHDHKQPCASSPLKSPGTNRSVERDGVVRTRRGGTGQRPGSEWVEAGMRVVFVAAAASPPSVLSSFSASIHLPRSTWIYISKIAGACLSSSIQAVKACP